MPRALGLLCLAVATSSTGKLLAQDQTHVAPVLQVTQVEPIPLIGANATQPVVFALNVTAHCDDSDAQAPVTINLADTAMTAAANDAAPIALTIDADQLVGLNTQTLCARRSDESPANWLLRDAFSAQTALTCAGDDVATVTWAATPLSVTIDCGASVATDVAPETQTSDPTPAQQQPRQSADHQD